MSKQNKIDELLPCPFCGGGDVDPHGWLNGEGEHGPQCMGCGATGENADAWNARASLPVGVPDAEPVLIQAVAVTREDEEEGLRLEWLLEGGIAEMEFAGQVLFAMPEANSLCDEDGGAHVYIAPPPAPTVKESLSVATTVKAEQVQCEVCHGQGEVYSGRDQHFHYFDFQPPEPIMDVCPECGGEEAPSLPAAGSAGEEVEEAASILRNMIDSIGVHGNYSQESTLLFLNQALASIVAALSAQQSALPEFCCKHSYKVAKQAAWGARDLTKCKCDHNEHCEHCWPDAFKEGGKWHGGFETQQSAPERVSVPVLTDKEREDLLEFHEAVCCDAGHRVEKDGMRRLSEIGAVQPMGFGKHRLTEFGVALLASHGRGEA